MYLTLVFYDYPLALSEIHNWENEQKNCTKLVLTNNQITFILNDKNEKVCCFDMNVDNLKAIKHELKISNKEKFDKVLIFGLVHKSKLLTIIEILDLYSE